MRRCRLSAALTLGTACVAGQTFVGNRFANTPKVQASLAATCAWSAPGLSQLQTTLGVAARCVGRSGSLQTG